MSPAAGREGLRGMRPGPNAIVGTDEIVARLSAGLGARDDVVFAYLFGSHGRYAAHPRSDVDVAVWLRGAPDPITVDPLLDLIGVVTTALKRDDVDVVILNEAPLWLATSILQGRLLFDRDETVRVRAESAIMSRYHDRLPYFQRHIEHAGKVLAERGFS